MLMVPGEIPHARRKSAKGGKGWFGAGVCRGAVVGGGGMKEMAPVTHIGVNTVVGSSLRKDLILLNVLQPLFCSLTLG